MKRYVIPLIFSTLNLLTVRCDTIEYVTIAILAKDKAHTLPLYLACIEQQTWPPHKTYLYIRTNNNTDETASILSNWINKIRDKYAGIFFNDHDLTLPVEQYGQHEWNSERFKALGKIRQDSVDWAWQHKSHYFVADCDNFIKPHTLETLVSTQLPIVAPLLIDHTRSYANFHAAVDSYGFAKLSHISRIILDGEIRGLLELPVVHCTYFIRYDILDKVSYDDKSGRHEYVIFSDFARKQGVPQYLDTREIYGAITFAENTPQLQKWLRDFNKINQKSPNKLCSFTIIPTT